MLHKCANPDCAAPFRHLGQGKLFQIEMEDRDGWEPSERVHARKRRLLRRVERYWLCDQCAPCLTLAVDGGRGLVTVPLPGQQKRAALATVPPRQIHAGKYPAGRVGLRAGG